MHTEHVPSDNLIFTTLLKEASYTIPQRVEFVELFNENQCFELNFELNYNSNISKDDSVQDQ